MSEAKTPSKSTPQAAPADIAIRPLDTLDAFARCVELQLEVWGFADSDAVPRRMFVVAHKAGGQVLGAFDTARSGGADGLRNMVGFLLALPGYRNRHSYLHSHMMAVQAPYRNLGIARQMKLAQRDDALARRIELIEWTFDPLEIKNSYLNIERLGAISRRYVVDLYGMTSSDLQNGLPSDRLYAEWWLNSRRVITLLDKGTMPHITPEQMVEVPGAIYEWRASDIGRPLAIQVQERNREALRQAFAVGLSVTGYSRDVEGNGAFELAHWDEPLVY